MTKTFKQTSDEPYLRHHYKLVYSNEQSVVFDNYADVWVAWSQTPSDFVSHIEVLDISEKKKKKGFQ